MLVARKYQAIAKHDIDWSSIKPSETHSKIVSLESWTLSINKNAFEIRNVQSSQWISSAAWKTPAI